MSDLEYQLRMAILQLRFIIAGIEFDAHMARYDLLRSVVATYPKAKP